MPTQEGASPGPELVLPVGRRRAALVGGLVAGVSVPALQAAFGGGGQGVFGAGSALSSFAGALSLDALASVVTGNLVPLVLMMVASGGFSAAETAITTLYPWKVKELALQEEDATGGGTAPAGPFTLLERDVTRFLTAVLIGSTLCSTVTTALITQTATALFGTAGLAIATAASTALLVLFCEILPKSVAVRYPIPVARTAARPLYFLATVLYPIGRACQILVNIVLRLLGLETTAVPFVTEKELEMVLDGATTSGAVEAEEADFIKNVLEMESTPVRRCMTPLVDVVAIEEGASLKDLWKLWQGFQYSRVPVFRGRIDNIVGIAFSKDILDYVEGTSVLDGLRVADVMERPSFFVPDSMSVWKLLQEFQVRNVHMAVVVNEFGGCSGIVTLEDVVEEVVGEIYDETDSGAASLVSDSIVRRGAGLWDVDASSGLDELLEALDVDLPQGEYETVAGLILHLFGRIPEEGETTTFEAATRSPPEVGGEETGADAGSRESADSQDLEAPVFRVTVMASSARRVRKVRFEQTSGSVPSLREGAGGVGAAPLPPGAVVAAPSDALDPSEARESLDELQAEVMAMDVSVSAAAYERLDVAALKRRREKLEQAQAALSVRGEPGAPGVGEGAAPPPPPSGG